MSCKRCGRGLPPVSASEFCRRCIARGQESKPKAASEVTNACAPASSERTQCAAPPPSDLSKHCSAAAPSAAAAVGDAAAAPAAVGHLCSQSEPSTCVRCRRSLPPSSGQVLCKRCLGRGAAPPSKAAALPMPASSSGEGGGAAPPPSKAAGHSAPARSSGEGRGAAPPPSKAAGHSAPASSSGEGRGAAPPSAAASSKVVAAPAVPISRALVDHILPPPPEQAAAAPSAVNRATSADVDDRILEDLGRAPVTARAPPCEARSGCRAQQRPVPRGRPLSSSLCSAAA